MIIAHEASDNHILAGWSYFAAWRASRNGLLLLDALESVQRAELEWRRRAAGRPMRREWHVLRRCVMRGIVRLRGPLNAARSPSETQRALLRDGKRPQLARVDQLQRQALLVALDGSGSKSGSVDFKAAAQLLERWGIKRTHGYLRKFASENGLTRRRGEHPIASQSGAGVETWDTLSEALRPISYSKSST